MWWIMHHIRSSKPNCKVGVPNQLSNSPEEYRDINCAACLSLAELYNLKKKIWHWKRCRINCIWPRRQYSNVLLYVNCATVKFNILCNKLGCKGSVFKNWWKFALNYYLNFADTYFNSYFDELWEQYKYWNND